MFLHCGLLIEHFLNKHFGSPSSHEPARNLRHCSFVPVLRTWHVEAHCSATHKERPLDPQDPVSQLSVSVDNAHDAWSESGRYV